MKILVVTLAMTSLLATPAFASVISAEAELLESDAEIGNVIFAETELLHSHVHLFGPPSDPGED